MQLSSQDTDHYFESQIRRSFSVTAESYLKKKMLPKMQVDFFDDPPTIGEIHQNQIFKFVDHF